MTPAASEPALSEVEGTEPRKRNVFAETTILYACRRTARPAPTRPERRQTFAADAAGYLPDLLWGRSHPLVVEPRSGTPGADDIAGQGRWLFADLACRTQQQVMGELQTVEVTCNPKLDRRGRELGANDYWRYLTESNKWQ